jgi:AcrR family transcriptional regulator
MEKLAQMDLTFGSLSDIAVLSGVTSKAMGSTFDPNGNVYFTPVYRRWPSKQELVRDALLSITLGSDHAAPNTGSLRTDLLAIARRHVEVTAKPGVQALFRIFVAEGGDPELASIVRSLREAFAGVPREVIAAAVARGELAPDVNPSLVFEILGAAQHWWLLFERMPFDESLVEHVIDLLLHGALQPRQFPTSRNQ